MGAAVKGELRVSGSNDWWARTYFYRTIASLLYDKQDFKKIASRAVGGGPLGFMIIGARILSSSLLVLSHKCNMNTE